jgi:chromosome segregation ATPase
MSTMLVEIYDALKEAGASEEKARAAATSLAGRDQRWNEIDLQFRRTGERFDGVERRLDNVEGRLGGVEQRLGNFEHRLDLVEQALEGFAKRLGALEEKVIAVAQGVAVLKAELGLMKWMHGVTIGGVLALLVKAFFG